MCQTAYVNKMHTKAINQEPQSIGLAQMILSTLVIVLWVAIISAGKVYAACDDFYEIIE
jgi:hypothetical protein